MIIIIGQSLYNYFNKSYKDREDTNLSYILIFIVLILPLITRFFLIKNKNSKEMNLLVILIISGLIVFTSIFISLIS